MSKRGRDDAGLDAPTGTEIAFELPANVAPDDRTTVAQQVALVRAAVKVSKRDDASEISRHLPNLPKSSFDRQVNLEVARTDDSGTAVPHYYVITLDFPLDASIDFVRINDVRVISLERTAGVEERIRPARDGSGGLRRFVSWTLYSVQMMSPTPRQHASSILITYTTVPTPAERAAAPFVGTAAAAAHTVASFIDSFFDGLRGQKGKKD